MANEVERQFRNYPRHLSEAVQHFRTKFIRAALEKHHGNIRAAARELGENPSTFARWVRLVHLDTLAHDLRRRRVLWLVDRMAPVMVLAGFFLYSKTLGG